MDRTDDQHLKTEQSMNFSIILCSAILRIPVHLKRIFFFLHFSLHYTEAVLTELFRVSSIAPIAPPHRVTKDTHINGYSIPKVQYIY